MKPIITSLTHYYVALKHRFHKRSKLLSLLSLFLLAGCYGDAPPCQDPDDFGFPKFTMSGTGYNVSGEYTSEVSSWYYSNYVVTGDPLVIKVRPPEEKSDSKWTSWFYGEVSGPYCQTSSGDWCPDPNEEEMPLTNKPCWFRDGAGLYALIAPPTGDNNPNSSDEVKLAPPAQFHTFHLYKPYQAGTFIPNYNKAPDNKFVDGKLYFKILDRYYSDNGGQYYVVLKSGVRDPDYGPIAKLIYLVTDTLNDAAKRIYQTMTNGTANVNGTVETTEFVKAIRALLILYIIITCIVFAMGMAEMTQGNLMVHIFKISIMLALISPSSWEFFNGYLFTFFVSGLIEIIGLILKPVTGDIHSVFNFFDTILHHFFSQETSHKIISIIFGQFPEGLFFAIILYVGFVVVIISLAKGVLYFLLSLIAIALLIVLAPIFLSFVLFQITRDYFNRWLKQLFSYAMQPILIFAAIGLITSVILHEMHRILGFKICWKTWFSIDFSLFKNGKLVDLKSWLPDISATKGMVQIPDPHLYKGTFYQAYEREEERYLDLPYLDLNDTSDAAKAIEMLSGNYVTFTDMLILGAIIFLWWRLFDMVPTFARTIAGTAGSFARISSQTGRPPFETAWGRLFGNAHQVGLYKQALNLATGGRYGNATELLRRTLPGGLHLLQDKVGGAIEGLRDGVKSNLKKAPLAKGYYEFKDNINATIRTGTETRGRALDSIGRRIETMGAYKDLMKNHVLNQVSLGALGKNALATAKDASGNTDPYGRSNLDIYLEKKGYALGWDDNRIAYEQSKKKHQYENTFTLGRLGKTAVGVGLFNPPLGLAIAGAGLAYKTYKAYKERSLDGPSTDRVNVNDAITKLDNARNLFNQKDSPSSVQAYHEAVNDAVYARTEIERAIEQGNLAGLDVSGLESEYQRLNQEFARLQEARERAAQSNDSSVEVFPSTELESIFKEQQNLEQKKAELEKEFELTKKKAVDTIGKNQFLSPEEKANVVANMQASSLDNTTEFFNSLERANRTQKDYMAKLDHAIKGDTATTNTADALTSSFNNTSNETAATIADRQRVGELQEQRAAREAEAARERRAEKRKNDLKRQQEEERARQERKQSWEQTQKELEQLRNKPKGDDNK